MEHDHSDDEWGFWEPDRTRRLPRIRGGEPTRAHGIVRPGSRTHGSTQPVPVQPIAAGRVAADEVPGDPLTTTVPVVPTADLTDLFDDLGPVDEFPGLDELGATDVPVVSTARRSWRERLRRDSRGRLDPFVTRLGVVVVASALALPIAVAASAGGASTNGTAADPRVAVTVAPATASAVTASAASADPSTAAPVAGADADVVTAAATEPSATAAGSTEAVASSAAPSTARAKAKVASPTAEPSSTASAQQARSNIEAAGCSADYEILPGDYWLGIADRADVDVDDLLAVNGAVTDTPLYAGRTICLPAGATTPVPAPATTAAPDTTAVKTTTATTAKPTTTDAPVTTKAPATTKAPSTTKAPTTTAKATTTTAAPATTKPARTYTRDEVIQIIRDVWPDDLEDKAIAIATRESNLVPAVRNYCCFGLFQIYFSVHNGWLAQIGVTEATQLYDPLVNANAALALYFRSGGWGPWGG